MMTFLTVWFLGIIITAGLVFLVCRGEEVKYKELGIIAFMLVVWPIGLPCILIALSRSGLRTPRKWTRWPSRSQGVRNEFQIIFGSQSVYRRYP